MRLANSSVPSPYFDYSVEAHGHASVDPDGLTQAWTMKPAQDHIARLERSGHERALIYKTFLLTGMRKGELASLTVGQLDFSGPVMYAIPNAADEKAAIQNPQHFLVYCPHE